LDVFFWVGVGVGFGVLGLGGFSCALVESMPRAKVAIIA
jgi:hypothetical protein